MISGVEVKQKKRNLFMTNEEAVLLWSYSKRWSSKWQCMVALGLFRGMRIKEICYANIYDFTNDEFSKLNVVLCKSHIQDEFPIIPDAAAVIRDYVKYNRHIMKDGFLFPGQKQAHMKTSSAEAMFAKIRNQIGEKHPSFLDRYPVMKNGVAVLNKFGNPQYRYRISWHSCRRWFETSFWEEHKDIMKLRDIMRYRDVRSCEPYINAYELWKNEEKILQKTFGKIINDFNLKEKGQTTMKDYNL